MLIDNGKNSNSAKLAVNSWYQGEVHSASRDEVADFAIHGRAHIILLSAISPGGANRIFFYLGNNGLEELWVKDIHLSSTALDVYEILTGDTSTVTGGTAVTARPVSVGNSAGVTLDAQTGAPVGTMAGNMTLTDFFTAPANTTVVYPGPGGIHLPPRTALALRVQGGVTVINGSLTVLNLPSFVNQ